VGICQHFKNGLQSNYPAFNIALVSQTVVGFILGRKNENSAHTELLFGRVHPCRRLIVSGIILVITALAKLASSCGTAHILLVKDPILRINYRYIFIILGCLELVIGVICLSVKGVYIRFGLLAWLATMFLTYRLGLVFLGYPQYCPCMGTLTDAIHMSPDAAAAVMRFVFAYLLIGSYGIGFCLWKQKLCLASPQQNP
jgi:hypothetical protein